VTDLEVLIARLISIAREATPGDLIEIAKADRHTTPEETERHRATLEQVIFQTDGMFSEDHYWFPSEAVELYAHVWHPDQERAFAVATALLMANALATDVGMGHMEFRWAGLHRHYANMQPEYREPILAGFVWLSRLDDWDYLSGASSRSLIDPANVPSPLDVYRENCK